jgi:hypothetical protein
MDGAASPWAPGSLFDYPPLPSSPSASGPQGYCCEGKPSPSLPISRARGTSIIRRGYQARKGRLMRAGGQQHGDRIIHVVGGPVRLARAAGRHSQQPTYRSR